MSIYIMVYGGQYFFAAMVSLALDLTGMVMSATLGVRQEEAPPDVEELPNLGLLSLFALGGAIIFSYILNLIYYTPATQTISISTFYGIFTFSTILSSSYVVGFMFIAIIQPNSEEQFFRGFVGNTAIVYMGEGFGILFQAAVFGSFHIAVDGLNWQVLGTIALSGATYMAIDVATGRLLTSVLAHMGNNALSFAARGSIITALGVAPFQFQAILPLQVVFPLAVFGVLAFKQARGLRRPS